MLLQSGLVGVLVTLSPLDSTLISVAAMARRSTIRAVCPVSITWSEPVPTVNSVALPWVLCSLISGHHGPKMRCLAMDVFLGRI